MSEQDPDDTGSGDGGTTEDVDPDSGPSAGGGEVEDDAPEDSREGLDEIATEPERDAASALREVLDSLDADPDVAPADREVPAELVERVETADVETIAAELAALGSRVETLETRLEAREAEVDDLESRLARKQADFQNYKQRQEERMAEEKRRATEDLVERLLDVRDNLARALEQDEDADIRGGVESTLRGFDEELARENVERIEPEPGDETDPQRHEVLMCVESDRPEGTVADVHRPGYEMAGKVLRAAQVTTSDGDGGDEGESGDDREASDAEAPVDAEAPADTEPPADGEDATER